jgi:glycyl-tRNA synthetase beta chain
VHHFQTLPEAQSLAAANKRVKNILSKNPVDSLGSPSQPKAFNKQQLEAPAEQALADFILSKELELKPLVKKAEYTQALQALASLKDPVDRFFTEVMVMVEDESLRNNRIALLTQLRHLFLEIADISVL